MGGDAQGASEILDRLRDAAEGGGDVSVGDVVDALGDRARGPLLVVPALIDISPVGGIPTPPTVLAAVMAPVAVQIVLGRTTTTWLPGVLPRRSVPGERMIKATDKLRPVGRWFDRWFHGRMTGLVTLRTSRIAAVLIPFLCLSDRPWRSCPSPRRCRWPRSRASGSP